jgi:outer membrane protein
VKNQVELNLPLAHSSKIIKLHKTNYSGGYMKRFQIYLICLAILLLYTLNAYAVDQQKIAVVDIQKILNESEAGKKAKRDLESLIISKQNVIDEKGKAVEKFKSDLEKQASVLSADARKSKEDELERMIREYQRLVQDSQTEVKKKENDLTDAILKDIKEIVEQTGALEGYSIIFEKGMLIYSSNALDITDSIIKKFDESKSKSKK